MNGLFISFKQMGSGCTGCFRIFWWFENCSLVIPMITQGPSGNFHMALESLDDFPMDFP